MGSNQNKYNHVNNPQLLRTHVQRRHHRHNLFTTSLIHVATNPGRSVTTFPPTSQIPHFSYSTNIHHIPVTSCNSSCCTIMNFTTYTVALFTFSQCACYFYLQTTCTCKSFIKLSSLFHRPIFFFCFVCLMANSVLKIFWSRSV